MSVNRVAVISYHSSPLLEPGAGDAGGMTVYVRSLAESLAREGVHTDIFTRATTDTQRVVELSPSVRVVCIEAGPRRAIAKEDQHRYVVDFAAGIRAFAGGQRIDYDVIHSHYWHSGLAGKRLARWWGVPLVHSHHTLGLVKNGFLAPGDVPEPRWRLEGEREVVEAADVLIASTEEEFAQLACLYGVPHDLVKTIHPGVDHSLFHPGSQASARSRVGVADELVMLYVGRIQPLKGIELALRAVEELRPALDRDLLLLIVGGASGRSGEAELERLRGLTRSLAIEGNVRFEGPQPHERLPDFYRSADLVCVCSHSESFGFAALEAHACGIPVIGTAVGGLAHILQDGASGFLVPERDPAVFAARAKTLLADDDLRSRFAHTAQVSSRRFSWSSTSRTFLELYDCLAREALPEACTC